MMNVVPTKHGDSVMIMLILAKTVDAEDKFQAYISAKLLQRALLSSIGGGADTSILARPFYMDKIKSAQKNGRVMTKALLPDLKHSGWDMDRILLHDLGWRVDWCNERKGNATRKRRKKEL